MTTFWDLFERSVIVQSLITLAVVGVLCWMVARANPVPDAFLGLTMTIVGYWFGSKEAVAMRRLAMLGRGGETPTNEE